MHGAKVRSARPSEVVFWVKIGSRGAHIKERPLKTLLGIFEYELL